MAEVKHTPLFIRDYGQPVELSAAECQFALLDAPDGAPVAYVYMPEDAAIFAAVPDLFEAGTELQTARRAHKLNPSAESLSRVRAASHAFDAALSKATTQQEGR